MTTPRDDLIERLPRDADDWANESASAHYEGFIARVRKAAAALRESYARLPDYDAMCSPFCCAHRHAQTCSKHPDRGGE